MDLAPYSGAISSVADLLNGILKRILPTKMSEAEAAALQTTITLELMKADWAGVEKEYTDRADARALAKADVEKGNWFTNVLSATVRPVFGYIVMATFFSTIISQVIPGVPTIVISDIQKEIMLAVIYFFFGGRTLEKGMSLWMGGKPGTKS